MNINSNYSGKIEASREGELVYIPGVGWVPAPGEKGDGARVEELIKEMFNQESEELGKSINSEVGYVSIMSKLLDAYIEKKETISPFGNDETIKPIWVKYGDDSTAGYDIAIDEKNADTINNILILLLK
jgi:hypothetical protein